MLKRKFTEYRRNYKGFALEVLVPLLLVISGFALSTVEIYFNSPSRPVNIDMFPLKQQLLVNSELITPLSDIGNIRPEQLFSNLDSDKFDIQYVNYTSTSSNNSEHERNVLELHDELIHRNREIEPNRYASYLVYSANDI